jgi:predicted kinase
MQLVVFSGLPGTGKSSLAEAVGRQLSIPVFAKDWLEGALVRCQLQPTAATVPNLGFASYELLTTLAERQVRLGQSVILDSVASPPAIRTAWHGLAAQYGAGWRVIECQCSDEAVHRARLAGRVRGIPGWHELDWADVQTVAANYAPWDEPRLVLDAVQPWADNVAAALRYLAA